MEIIPDKKELDAIRLAVKSPGIVDWKIHKEGKKSYYQIIRADRKSQMYMFFSQMLTSFDMEYLEDLYKLVKAKYGSTRPVEDLDLLLKDISPYTIYTYNDLEKKLQSTRVKTISESYYCQYKEVTAAQVEDQVGERVIKGPEMIEVANEKVAVAKEKLKEARTHLSYVEEPEAILDRQDRVMRNKTIPFVKILWRNNPEREATWETEESIRTSYPYFLP
nr:hypothetical protein [Tanacetum cinerariifolium]